jgi:threonine dehydrogenase-like Zn-dependent dehydrogenase
MFPLVETALQITLDAGPVFADPVVVFGLGAVGALASILLQRAGARVLAVEPSMARRELLSGLGVTTVTPEAIGSARAADGDPVRLVIEASGNPHALRAALPLLAHEGTMLVASWYGTKEVSLPLGAEFHRRRLTLRSTQVSTIPALLSASWDVARRRRAAVELMPTLPLAELATHTFDWARSDEAFAAVDRAEEGLIHAALGYR